jgi:pimeloyl-ACP methyl ester carboxylesterase
MSTWVFLRGLTRESRHWGDFPATFASAVGDAEIISLDLPGNGRLHRLRSPASVAEMADAGHAELARRGSRPPYFLLGMSLGAMVALAWARRREQEIAGCVLINTSLRPFSSLRRRLRPANYPLLLKRALLGGSPVEWERMILDLTSNRPEDHAALLDAWTTWRQECPVSRANALRQLWAASRFRAKCQPAAPLLILSSAGDRLVDPYCSRQLALCWQVDHAEHPDAGHDLPLDDGAWVARQVAEWLATRVMAAG